ncbi:MAG: hypothetical protein GY793_07500 [Proteobacteria bacterium]|nr:hypothetical protein [Pseudomonadota bacterium]
METTQTKFKVGDRVIIHKPDDVDVSFFFEHSPSGIDILEDLINQGKQPLKKKNMLQRLTAQIKRLLNKDMQSQFKAGYINDGFELTSIGKDALLSILAIENEKVLAEHAEDYIKEVEDEEKSCDY